MRQDERGARAPGVGAGTLRHAAFWLVLLAAGGFMALDRAAGFDAVMDGLMLLLFYGGFVAIPIQILYRDMRLGPAGVGVFALAVLAVVAAFWSMPIQRVGVYDGTGGLVALHRLTGGADVDGITGAPWRTAALVCGLVAMAAVLTLDVMVWRLQRSSRGHAVNPSVAGAIAATSFATLPEPQGGTSVTRAAPGPDLGARRRRA